MDYIIQSNYNHSMLYSNINCYNKEKVCYNKRGGKLDTNDIMYSSCYDSNGDFLPSVQACIDKKFNLVITKNELPNSENPNTNKIFSNKTNGNVYKWFNFKLIYSF